MDVKDEDKSLGMSGDTVIESEKEDKSTNSSDQEKPDAKPELEQESSPRAPDPPVNSPVIDSDLPKSESQVQHEPDSNLQSAISNSVESSSTSQDVNKANDKKKEDDKLSIYKALAIKLKKELIKSRDELQRLREDSQKECNDLKQTIEDLEKTLESEKQSSATLTATLEAKVKSLKIHLDTSEADLQSLQKEFENYKIKASQIMQQNNPLHSQSNKTIEEQRYKQLKELNETHLKHISNLELRLSAILEKNDELEREGKRYQEQLNSYQEKLASFKAVDAKCETLSRENENLKLALKQFRTKLKEPAIPNVVSLLNCDDSPRDTFDKSNTNCAIEDSKNSYDGSCIPSNLNSINSVNALPQHEDNSTRLSPSTSVKDESQATSSSSFDGSTSGYVHIKPTTFEIISRSSVLEDAQNQIDNLTKAYLDSENTNSLLSEQVRALKEEIRRLQLITERIDLANNLEYLKNIVFKFISLDANQTQQKQRLVPVLSTVLKLSPDETAKLNSIATVDKTSMASSFFKL